MKPIRHKAKCNRCHGGPAKTINEVIDRYDSKSAFFRKEGDVIATLTVSVPANVIFEEANKNTYVFLGLLLLFFLVL